MKKLGLRAVAGSLAVLMVASVFAPATAANAADTLVTSKAPKTLVLTADMVDDDGEIVISNEDWDRIIVEKEVDAKNIYFDGVEVKELVVESGGTSTIQLWEVDAEQVTVKEPELEKLSFKDFLPFIEEEPARQAALEVYKESLAKDQKALKTAPKIVTKGDATVDQLVVRANAKLDLGTGEIGVVALQASNDVERANVTLSNYEGEVTYTGTTEHNVINLKSVSSVITNLKVDESNANNYFYLTAKKSVVENAEIAGNAKVSLNAPVDTVDVTEKATAAQVCILDEVGELKVSADAAKVELTENAEVDAATVAGDKVNITGKGQLKEAAITGKGAYVTTDGTKVEGENTYVKPVYVPPVVKVNLVPYDGVTVSNAADGSATITFGGQYKSAAYMVPESIDVNCIKGVKLTINTSAQFCVKLVGEGNADIKTDYPGWGLSAPTRNEYKYEINPLVQKLDRIEFMSLQAEQPDLTVISVEFDLYDVAPEPPAEDEPGISGAVDLNTKVAVSGDEPTVSGDSLVFTAGQNKCAFDLPGEVKAGDKVEFTVDLDFTTLETASTVRFYLIKDGVDKNVSDIAMIKTGEVDSASVKQTLTMTATGDANQILFVTFAWDGSTPQVVTLNGITFGSAEPAPTAPSTLTEDWEVYTVADLSKDGYGYEVADAEYYNGENVAISGQYQEIRYKFAEDLDLSKYEKMLLTFSTKSTESADQVVIKLVDKDAELDDYDNAIPMLTMWDITAADTTDLEIDLADYSDEKLSWVTFMAKNGATEMTFYRIALLPKEGSTTPDPTPEVTPTPDPTPEVTPTPDPTPEVTSATVNLINFVAQGNAEPVSLNADGTITVSFASNYAGSYLPIPAEYAGLRYVEVSVSSTKGGEELAGGNQIAFIDTEGAEIVTKYSKGVITVVVPEGKALGKIVFNAQEASADATQDMTIGYVKLAKIVNIDLSTFNKGGATEMVQNADGTLTLTFGDAAYTGSGMVIPEEYAACTYFEVKAVAVDESGTVEKPGVQVVFKDTDGNAIGDTLYTAWSGYVGSCEIPEGKTLGEIVVNNQDKNVKLEVYYIAARY